VTVLLVQALLARWRAYAAIAILAFTIGLLAAASQVFPRSVADSIAAADLDNAQLADRSLEVVGSSSGGADEVDAAYEAVRLLMPAYKPIYGAQVSVMDLGRNREILAYREDFCQHATMLSGRCPLGPGEVVVPAAVATDQKLKAGAQLQLSEAIKPDPQSAFQPGPGSQPYDVVGVWQPRDSSEDYWGVDAGKPDIGLANTVFTTPEGLGALPHETESSGVLILPDRKVLLAGDWKVLERAGLPASALRNGDKLHATLDKVAAKRKFIETMTPAVVLPVLALGCWVLFLVLGARMQRDRQEAGMQSLRGLPILTRWWLAGGIPTLIVAVATPVGAIVAAAVLRAGVPVRMMLYVLVAELAVVVVATAGLMRTRLTQVLRRVTADRDRGVPVLEIGAVTLAVASFAQMKSGDRTGIGTFAASLTALAAALVVARGIYYLARPYAKRSLARGKVTRGLALALLARRSGGRQLLAITAAVTALLALVVSAFDVASYSRTAQVDLAVGGERVLHVVAPPARVLDAIEKADPERTHAVLSGLIDQPAPIVAVDLSRAAAVRWNGVAAAAKALATTEKAPPPGGRELELTFAADLKLIVLPASSQGDLTFVPPAGQPAGLPRPQLNVSVVMEMPDHVYTRIPIDTPIVSGTRVYTVDLPPQCVQGCRVAGMTAFNSGLVAGTVKLSKLAVSGTEVPGTDGFHPPGVSSGAEWTWEAVDFGGSSQHWLLPPDVPDRLPVAYTGTLPSSRIGALTFPLDGGQYQPLGASLPEQALPRVGPDGLLADLGGVLRATLGQAYLHDLEIWLTGDAPAGFVDKLKAEDISVVRDERYADALSQANHTPTALTLRMQMFAALVGVGLLLGVLIFLAAGDRSAAELAGLRLSGMRARTIRRALRTTYLIAVVAGMLIGVVCAALAWLLARAALPLTDGTPWVPPPVWPQPLVPGIALLATLAAIVAGVFFALARGDREAILAGRANDSAFAVRAGTLSDHITPEESNRD
jgi:putative ABC transport system permease protein